MSLSIKDNLKEIVEELYALISNDYRKVNENEVRDLIKGIVAASQMDTKFVDNILESE